MSLALRGPAPWCSKASLRHEPRRALMQCRSWRRSSSSDTSGARSARSTFRERSESVHMHPFAASHHESKRLTTNPRDPLRTLRIARKLPKSRLLTDFAAVLPDWVTRSKSQVRLLHGPPFSVRSMRVERALATLVVADRCSQGLFSREQRTNYSAPGTIGLLIAAGIAPPQRPRIVFPETSS